MGRWRDTRCILIMAGIGEFVEVSRSKLRRVLQAIHFVFSVILFRAYEPNRRSIPFIVPVLRAIKETFFKKHDFYLHFPVDVVSLSTERQATCREAASIALWSRKPLLGKNELRKKLAVFSFKSSTRSFLKEATEWFWELLNIPVLFALTATYAIVALFGILFLASAFMDIATRDLHICSPSTYQRFTDIENFLHENSLSWFYIAALVISCILVAFEILKSVFDVLTRYVTQETQVAPCIFPSRIEAAITVPNPRVNGQLFEDKKLNKAFKKLVKDSKKTVSSIRRSALRDTILGLLSYFSYKVKFFFVILFVMVVVPILLWLYITKAFILPLYLKFYTGHNQVLVAYAFQFVTLISIMLIFAMLSKPLWSLDSTITLEMQREILKSLSQCLAPSAVPHCVAAVACAAARQVAVPPSFSFELIPYGYNILMAVAVALITALVHAISIGVVLLAKYTPVALDIVLRQAMLPSVWSFMVLGSVSIVLVDMILYR